MGRELWWSGSSWVEKIKFFFYGALNFDAMKKNMMQKTELRAYPNPSIIETRNLKKIVDKVKKLQNLLWEGK